MILTAIIALVIGGVIGFFWGNSAGYDTGFYAAKVAYKPSTVTPTAAKPAPARASKVVVKTAKKRGRPVGSKNRKTNKTKAKKTTKSKN